MSNHLKLESHVLDWLGSQGLRIVVRGITPIKEATSLSHSKVFNSIFMHDFIAKFANECYNVELSLCLPICFWCRRMWGSWVAQETEILDGNKEQWREKAYTDWRSELGWQPSIGFQDTWPRQRRPFGRALNWWILSWRFATHGSVLVHFSRTFHQIMG